MSFVMNGSLDFWVYDFFRNCGNVHSCYDQISSIDFFLYADAKARLIYPDPFASCTRCIMEWIIWLLEAHVYTRFLSTWWLYHSLNEQKSWVILFFPLFLVPSCQLLSHCFSYFVHTTSCCFSFSLPFASISSLHSISSNLECPSFF